MLIATYVREPGNEDIDKAAKVGSVGGLLAFFAVGCPVCNSSFSSPWASELSPGSPPSHHLAFASVLLMAWALRMPPADHGVCAVSVPTKA